ncbi:MAG: hypothetical protein EA404_02075 [Spirochaetaceae bacterium]|nr:MAG: hypothetical protein EA404_02075 [Spirochaetaceae bacterium]
MTVVLLPLLLSGCPKPFGALGKTGPLQIAVQQEYLTLAWDHTPARIPETASAVMYFRLYYREHGTRGRTMLAEVRAREAPTFMIGADAVLGTRQSGKYDFGVSSVTRSGNESAVHWSTDFEARPHGGWYLKWIRP